MATISSNAAIKSDIRSQMRTRRRTIGETERRDRSRRVIEMFLGHVPLEAKEKIGGFSPLPYEVDISLLMEILDEDGHHCAMPRLQDDNSPLQFHCWKRGDELIAHPKYKMLEPQSNRPVITPNIVIVPLLAFDNRGHRLGFGGGFYDRTLAVLHGNSDILTIGVAYDFQQVKEIPSEPHDQKLDCVITETRVFICTDV